MTKGDKVRMPSGRTAVVVKSEDGEGDVELRYLDSPPHRLEWVHVNQEFAARFLYPVPTW